MKWNLKIRVCHHAKFLYTVFSSNLTQIVNFLPDSMTNGSDFNFAIINFPDLDNNIRMMFIFRTLSSRFVTRLTRRMPLSAFLTHGHAGQLPESHTSIGPDANL